MKQNPQHSDDVHRAALATLTVWVAAIADRVNNPIASTLAGLSLIQRALETQGSTGSINRAQITESLERIKGRLTSLSEYVQELMNFGQPDAFLPMNVKLPTAAATVALDCEARGELTGELIIDFGEQTVWADYARFKVALKSLLVNGWEAAARQSTPTVRLSSTAVQGGTEIIVEDNGPGFAQVAASRAGEPFFSTKEAGTGLGLAIVQKFVAAHGGTMKIDTSPTLGGAMVRVFLPSRKLEENS